MSVARILSRARLGLEAPLVHVEVHLSGGLPSFTIVGLPAPVVRESRERVRAALQNSGYEFPSRRITVNLAPVELSKQGGSFDLPIALGLLHASGQLEPGGCKPYECYGELGLTGELKAVRGLFLAAVQARQAGHALIVPSLNAEEVALSGHAEAFAVSDLRAAARRLTGLRQRAGEAIAPLDPGMLPGDDSGVAAAVGLEQVIGQWHAKRALLVAATGGHSVLLVGPPGSGKSMLAARLPRLLPPLTSAEAQQLAAVASMAGLRLEARRWRTRPFRSPHHTVSASAMVGGGQPLQPGEISLAHGGVLFLDELPEFDRRVLEALREPLESGCISVSRTAARYTLPAQFQLIAAMNPCPCGYRGDTRQACRCSLADLSRYRRRISGPLLDRIDLRIQVPRLRSEELSASIGVEPRAGLDASERAWSEAPELVRAARAWRISRSGGLSARLSLEQLRSCCALTPSTSQLLQRSCEQLALTARGVQRLLAVSRTVADLAASETIDPPHLAEAIQLRRYWASETM